MSRRKVLVSGASGLIAGLLLPALRERYDLTLLDVKKTTRNGDEVEGIQIANLADSNRDVYRHHFRDVDAVVHLGFVATHEAKEVDRYFQNEMLNVQMAYNVYQVAWEENVRRVVMASSNHAADYYEPLILAHRWDFVTPDMRALSDNYYGWAKEVYEHLGFVFAVGKVNGSPLQNVQIRIGGPRETDLDVIELGDLVRMRRALAVYISQRDLAQLVIKSIETEDIQDEQGVPFQIVYGISNNNQAFWGLANARRVLGYEPQDNSELRFIDKIQQHIAAAESKLS
ncbi:NAD-dependent epimerase/dehydratase family protein [bacterium]|nr:NAD-dependent epimerase/dehydratase family protein [bacterium]